MASSSLPFLNRLCQLSLRQAADAVPDEQLLERFASAREADAFTALVQRHGPMVFGVCQRLLRETHDAEDAFQATFLVLARKAASIRKGESVGSWLHGVALRMAHKARVESARRSRRERTRTAPAAVADGDAVTWGEIRSLLDEELDKVSANVRAPLVLCYLEGRTQDEAARQLGLSKSTLRRRLERGRELLRRRLARRGLTLSTGLCAPLLSRLAALPRTLTTETVKGALAFSSAPGLGRELVGQPVALARELLKSVLLARVKWAAALVLSLSLLGIGGLCAHLAVADKAPPQSAEHLPPGQNVEELKPAQAPVVAVDAFGDPLPAEVVARLGTVRFRHGAAAFAVDFAPDGKSLASAGIDGGVHVWEAATGKELLWIQAVGQSEPIPGGLGGVLGLAYAPDGKSLAAARMNQPPCLWDLTTGKEIRQFGRSRARANWVVFSPDGKTLAYGGAQGDPTVWLFDAHTGKEGHRTGGLKGSVSRGVFSPDGKTLAFADDEAVHVYDLGAEQRRVVFRPGDEAAGVSSLAFSPDGKTLASIGSENKIIRLVEVATGKVIQTITLSGKREEGSRIRFAPDGKSLITGHEDGFVRFWDVASGTKIRQFQAHDRTIVALALSRDGRSLATSCNDHIDGDHLLRVWETETGKPLVRHPGPEAGIAHLVFSPDSRRAATASWDGVVHVWEADSGKLLQRWETAGPLVFMPDSQTLVCGSWSDGKVRFLELATGKETRQFSGHPRGIRSLALARDGKTLATAGDDKFLRLWDVATGKQIHDFGGEQKSFLFRLALSPDGKLVASTHEDNVLRLWEVATGKLVREEAEPSSVGSIAFSPDGKLLASTGGGVAGSEPAIRLCDVATGKEVRKLPGCGDGLDGVAFSPDGRTLIWGGHGAELYLWEVASGQLRRTFSGHEGHLSRVAFSPDGRLMAAGSSDATVLIWDATGRRLRNQPSTSPSAADLDRLWDDLGAKAEKAYQASRTLKASPREAVALLEQHLQPVPSADGKRVAEALRNLDSDQFTVREKALKDLEALGEGVEPALRQVLAGKPSTEVRRKVEELLDQLDGAAGGRRARALEILEQLDTPEARRLLTALAHGAPDARLTREAQAALERMGR